MRVKGASSIVSERGGSADQAVTVPRRGGAGRHSCYLPSILKTMSKQSIEPVAL